MKKNDNNEKECDKSKMSCLFYKSFFEMEKCQKFVSNNNLLMMPFFRVESGVASYLVKKIKNKMCVCVLGKVSWVF